MRNFFRNILPTPHATTMERFSDLDKLLQTLISETREIRSETREIRSETRESVWANVFNQTISESVWLMNKTFSPGRWAVDYAFLYVLYRTLNEFKPKNILELRSGESSKMISQYIDFNKDAQYRIIEADENWINFLLKTNKLSDRAELIQAKYEIETYKGEDVLIFNNIEELLGKEQKYDYICIDAPVERGYYYSRIDVIKMIPQYLCDDFIIMLDDCGRTGEKNTIAEIDCVFKNIGMDVRKKVYSGAKDHCLWCTAQHAFFTTL